MKRRFVIYNSEGATGRGDFVFNSETQDMFFASINDAKVGIQDEIDVDEWGDLTESDFTIFEVTKVG